MDKTAIPSKSHLSSSESSHTTGTASPLLASVPNDARHQSSLTVLGPKRPPVGAIHKTLDVSNDPLSNSTSPLPQGKHIIDLMDDSLPIVQCPRLQDIFSVGSDKDGSERHTETTLDERIMDTCSDISLQKQSLEGAREIQPLTAIDLTDGLTDRTAIILEQAPGNTPTSGAMDSKRKSEATNSTPCASFVAPLAEKKDVIFPGPPRSEEADRKIMDLVEGESGSSDDQSQSWSSDTTPQAVIDLAEEEGFIEDDKEDIITEEELGNWLESQSGGRSRINRYGALQSTSVNSPPRTPTRNLPIQHPYRSLATYNHNGVSLRQGVNVELQDRTFISELGPTKALNEPHNSFMRIVNIIQDTRDQTVMLRGWLFQRAQYLNGILEKKKNELCWVLHVDEDDSRDMRIQAMETVPLDDVVRRRKIRLTNQPWPKLSFRDDADGLEDSDDIIRNERVLVCRFMYVCYYMCADRRDANSWSERVLQRLRAADCDKWSGPHGEPCALDDAELRKEWRGETLLGGAFLPVPTMDLQRQERVDLTFEDPVHLTQGESKPDPDITVVSSRKPRFDVDSPRITNVSTRVDWIALDGTEYYTINGFVPAKRPANVDESPQPRKRHQIGAVTSNTQLPQTTARSLKTRRRSSVIGIESPQHIPGPHQTPVQDLKPNTAGNSASSKMKRQYTFGDSFCGAGGMSRAASQTGLHIKYAFDCNRHACTSYEMNFPHAILHCLWAHEFVGLDHDCKVDIAHLSPPCQFFSDAHTVAGKDDETNTASIFAVGELLKKSKPRVVTLEQTFGIVLRAKHQGYLNALVQVFTSHGFSIRWRLLHCADYGLPQMRLRTFMIASW